MAFLHDPMMLHVTENFHTMKNVRIVKFLSAGHSNTWVYKIAEYKNSENIHIENEKKNY